jgi:hypothetical protein
VRSSWPRDVALQVIYARARARSLAHLICGEFDMAQAARTNATTAPPAPAVGRAPARRAGLVWGRAQQLVTRAGRKSFWPLVDQGVVSAGNFLTLVIVARALPAKSEYGVFGLLLEAIFYLNTLQGALVTYPLTVKGATADKDGLKRLATAALLMTCALAVPVALCATATAALAQHLTLGLAGAFALVAWQVQEVARKSLIAHFRYADAAWGDALRYLGTAACVWLAWRQGALTLPRVFWIIGALAALATLVQAAQVGLRAVGWRDLVRLAREFAAAAPASSGSSTRSQTSPSRSTRS